MLCFFLSPLGWGGFFRNMLNVCMVYAMVQMQCRRNWYNWTNERWVRVLKKQMMKKKTILIAAKCLIFSAWTPTGKWNAARTCSIIWQRYGKAASERTSEKRSQNESEQIVIFHLYWWNMVRCICAINHFVSAMIHLQQQTVHLLRLFWIQWCCIASKTQTTKIYALAFSTLILPNFFRLVFFSSFTFRYTYIVCIKCIKCILCSWSKRVKKKFNLSKIPRSSNFSRNSMDFFLLFIFICGCNKFVDNNKFHWLTETLEKLPTTVSGDWTFFSSVFFILFYDFFLNVCGLFIVFCVCLSISFGWHCINKPEVDWVFSSRQIAEK